MKHSNVYTPRISDKSHGFSLTELLITLLITIVLSVLVYHLTIQVFGPKGSDLSKASLRHIQTQNYGSVSTNFMVFDDIHFEHQRTSETEGTLTFRFVDPTLCVDTAAAAATEFHYYGVTIESLVVDQESLSLSPRLDVKALIKACTQALAENPIQSVTSYRVNSGS